METVAVVGLGAMGLPVAGVLARSGFAVAGFDVDERRRAAAESARVEVTASAADAARAATDVVILLVRTPEQAEHALAGEGGIGCAGRRRTVVLMSTVGVRAARALARKAGECGLDLLDAPVSGGVQGAASGRLTVMLGGPEHVRARALVVLDVLAAEIVVAGEEPGAGQGVKLVNQQVMCVNILGLLEGLRLGSALGLDRDAVLAVLGTGSGRNWAVDHWPEVRAFWESYSPGGSLELLRKDLALLLDEAAGAGVELPVSAATAGLLRDAWPGG